MAAKKKSTLAKMVQAVQDAGLAVVTATEEHVVKPVGAALGLTGGTPGEGSKKVRAEKAKRAAKKSKAAGEPAKPTAAAAKKSPAARTMTQPVAGKTTVASRMMSRKVTNSAKPTKVAGGGGNKGPRRGASKGR